MIRLERVSNGIDQEVDRLAAGPTAMDFAKFEIILQQQFAATQAAVHVITRSLKLSGKMESEATQDSWSGEISYGGTSAGIHNPVDYAEYERERDGNHDFLAAADRLSDRYISAMEDFLRG
jgi:hypothetical protein